MSEANSRDIPLSVREADSTKLSTVFNFGSGGVHSPRNLLLAADSKASLKSPSVATHKVPETLQPQSASIMSPISRKKQHSLQMTQKFKT